MLTPKGEHFSPCSTRGDVRWENQSRRNRNRQNFVVGSYFLTAFQSSENRAGFGLVVTCSDVTTCGMPRFPRYSAKTLKYSNFRLRITLQEVEFRRVALRAS